MNIHPLFVHFPIALLMSYAVIEILPLARWYPRAPWEAIKTFLVLAGAAGAGAAIGTGLLAKELLDESSRHIVEMHQLFALTTTGVFGTLAAAYLVRWFDALRNVTFLKTVSDLILKRWVAALLALLGIVAITITGTLGGIMVYGPDVDPIARFVYSLLF